MDSSPESNQKKAAASGASQCLNCGQSSTGRFCSSCGQRAGSLREPLHRFVGDAFVEYFGLDGRIWKTLGYLLFRPGKLTRDYLDGKRVRYLRPLRIYLFATLTFFFLVSMLDPAAQLRESIGADTVSSDTISVAQRANKIEDLLAADASELMELEQHSDSLAVHHDSVLTSFVADTSEGAIPDSILRNREEELADILENVEDARDDMAELRADTELRRRRFEWQLSVLEAFPSDSTIQTHHLIEESEVRFPGGKENQSSVALGLPDWLPRSSAVQRLNESRSDQERIDALADFVRDFIERLPFVMFLLLPVFALLLKVIYIRRKWFYTEHLVFGLHTHAFAFVVFSILAISSGFAFVPESVTGVLALLSLSIPIYFLLAIKKVYGQGWLKTLFKAFMLGWLYFFVLLGGAILAAMMAAAIG